MSDNGATSILPQTFLECGLCKGNDKISMFCKNCTFSLCKACATSHKATHPYQNHAVVPRTYSILRLYGPSRIATQCKLHPEKEISSYCNRCYIPCCISCLVEDHQLHGFSTIEDKYLDAEIRLNEYYRHLDTDVKPKLTSLEDITKAEVKEDSIRTEKVITDINDFRTKFIQKFNGECDSLVNQVENIANKNHDRLKEVEKSKEMFQSLKIQIEEKIQVGNFDLIQFFPPKLESLVPRLETPRIDIPTFSPRGKFLEVGLSRSSVAEINFKEIRTKSVNVQNIRLFDSNVIVRSIINDGEKAWFVSGGSATLYLYNNKGKIVKSVTVDPNCGNKDMVITQLEEMIVTCSDKKVRHVSANGVVTTLIDTAPFACEGVCLFDKEQIVICMCGKSGGHLGVYSLSGSKLREIQHEERYRESNGEPHCVVQNAQFLCVVYLGGDVLCMSDEGVVKWAYGRSEKFPSFYPVGICADRYNNLLVTDDNHRCVHYINKDGGLIRAILASTQTNFCRLSGICVDDDSGEVWVGNRRIKQFLTAKYLM